MRIRVTHKQLQMIEEQMKGQEEEGVDKDLSYIDEKCDNIYRTIMSSNVMEVIDGDLDLDQYLSIVKNLENMIQKIHSNESRPEVNNTMSASDIQEKDKKILDQYNKIKVLKNVLEEMKGMAEFNKDKKVNKVFSHKTAKIKG